MNPLRKGDIVMLVTMYWQSVSAKKIIASFVAQLKFRYVILVKSDNFYFCKVRNVALLLS